MHGIRFTAILIGLIATISMIGCAAGGHVHHAIAAVGPTAGNQVHGMVRFVTHHDGVHIKADIDGLTPGAQHAFHIHEHGDLTDPAAKSAGGHYNPEAMPHGRPHDDHRHAGDLGNLVADENGHASYDRVDGRFTISGDMNPVLGRAVIIHAGEDQFTQPTGGAGARIGAGVIGIAPPKDMKHH